MDTNLIEKDFGWIFFYNTKSYMDTGDNLDMLIGNAPILVDKKTKDIHIFGTSHPINYYIEEYERGNCEYKHSTN